MGRKGTGWAGWIPDIRDAAHAYKTIAKTVDQPKVYEGWIPFVLDQGELGSCGPHAAITLMASTMIQNNMQDWVHLSPLALYYYVREEMGTVHSDSGVYNRTMFSVMAKRGAPALHLWPYDLKKWDVAPSKEANEDSAKHQILKYHSIDGIDEMINCLAEGRGFVTGIPVYESFDNVNASNNIIPMPKPNEKMTGGHDMYYFGYNKHDKLVYVLNSWGKAWGKNGRGAIPFEYLDKLASDTWTITLMEEEL